MTEQEALATLAELARQKVECGCQVLIRGSAEWTEGDQEVVSNGIQIQHERHGDCQGTGEVLRWKGLYVFPASGVLKQGPALLYAVEEELRAYGWINIEYHTGTWAYFVQRKDSESGRCVAHNPDRLTAAVQALAAVAKEQSHA